MGSVASKNMWSGGPATCVLDKPQTPWTTVPMTKRKRDMEALPTVALDWTPLHALAARPAQLVRDALAKLCVPEFRCVGIPEAASAQFDLFFDHIHHQMCLFTGHRHINGRETPLCSLSLRETNDPLEDAARLLAALTAVLRTESWIADDVGHLLFPLSWALPAETVGAFARVALHDEGGAPTTHTERLKSLYAEYLRLYLLTGYASSKAGGDSCGFNCIKGKPPPTGPRRLSLSVPARALHRAMHAWEDTCPDAGIDLDCAAAAYVASSPLLVAAHRTERA